MENLEEKIYEIIAKRLERSPEEIVPQAEFVKDLRANSIQFVEMVMSFEDEFGIEIPDKDVEGIRVVQDAVTYLKGRLDA